MEYRTIKKFLLSFGKTQKLSFGKVIFDIKIWGAFFFCRHLVSPFIIILIPHFLLPLLVVNKDGTFFFFFFKEEKSKRNKRTNINTSSSK